MLTCPSCGQENPAGFRFCGACAAPLGDVTPAPREERKVVTVLFCDLVGSTAQAERRDPEDVRALLSRYHERVRYELERFGGTVEKFIGDAVMALFGAPTAHEDDPERAVRAALAIREWAGEEGELQVRIGITTGEALVALGARPEAGEGMASGDVVNTAARLQSSAPVNGILVDETTYRATERVIDFGPADAVEAKGKAAPVAAWEVKHARARLGVDVAQRGGAPLVGRRRELDVLRGALVRVREHGEAQLVTLIGTPGIGKSRLVYELFREVERGDQLTYWRQGRALPYGEGVTFWPLVEIANAHAGILETDSPDEAETKLRRALGEVLEGGEAEWVLGHLRPLVGLAGESELAGGRHEEAFAAWRRLFEALAGNRPLVLVFEDLQWADDGLLDFVDGLVERSSGVPLLCLCTARPELLDRRPSWGGGKLNSTNLALSPLSDGDTARLIASLLEQAVLDAETQSLLLVRAGGNPLYAEEYVRMLHDRDLLGSGAADFPLPETVQGVIAARLDVLPVEQKSLLQDGAVVGRDFWTAALASIAGEPKPALEPSLNLLERRGFIRRAQRSSVAGETEYAFRHILVRDVAYGQIPRGQRAQKHRRAAEWIESLSPERHEGRAEMLAHHYLSALELTRSAGAEPGDLAERASVALRDAAEHALTLNAFPAAARFFHAALELWPADDPGRAAVLFDYGRALWLGDERGVAEMLEARDAFDAAGDREAAAEAEAFLGQVEWMRGGLDRALAHLEQATELVAGVQSSRAKAYVLGAVARSRSLANQLEEANRVGEEALELARALGLKELEAHVLLSLGTASLQRGDRKMIAQLERAIELALSIGSAEALRGYNNLAYAHFRFGNLARSAELVDTLFEHAERFGNVAIERFSRAGVLLGLHFHTGRWDEAVRLAGSFVEEVEAGSPNYQEGQVRRIRARIRSARGDAAGARDDVSRALELAREVRQPLLACPVLASCAVVLLEAGHDDDAWRAAASVIEIGTAARHWFTHELPDLARVLCSLDRRSDFESLVATSPDSPWAEATRLYAAGDEVRAADVYGAMSTFDEADARLAAAKSLVAAGRHREGEEQLERSLEFFRSVGATRYVEEGERLLARTA